ncbi:4-oxalomesaconate tautomerase [Roseomonas aerophila]|uniref:4-oxalomesaconate tautomerase n=1 Tax=Teichococcus aerophilus TaxID=1224513 RepID=A0ABR7RH11_9PROT|nr:4-oxalomesaconate tautomerase [Pseudoroseomonas aerophila]MBC9205668.1 4-oxalomesaconate tautomerase [Pseudoroseomonas aerophila]
MSIRLPCVLMRGGTSRGPFFLAAHLPADPAQRDIMLLAALGSPHPLQIDGIGGGSSVTSKVAIVGPAVDSQADVEYLFAQVSVEQGRVDTKPNCGNMLAGVGPFAIEAGLVTPTHPETVVRIRNVNTGALVDAVVQTPFGAVTYDGDAEIPGVQGGAAPIALRFRDVGGSKTGQMFPTGLRQEQIDGVPVTLIDGAMPMMLVSAASLGTDADLPVGALEADAALLARIERLRQVAGRRMGLGDVSESVIPKPALLGPARHQGQTLTARYLTPHSVHRSMAVTGGITLAIAARTPGTVAFELASTGEGGAVIAHPAGTLQIGLKIEDSVVHWASVLRTARRIFEGHLFLPGRTLQTASSQLAAE